MSKCRRIDRIALTKGELKIIGDTEKQPEAVHRGEICPECGQRSLFPDSGCWKCISCGYSYCEAGR